MNLKEFKKRNTEAVAYLQSTKGQPIDTEKASECLKVINLQNNYRNLFNIELKDFMNYFNEYLEANSEQGNQPATGLIINEIKTDKTEFNDKYSSNPEPTTLLTTTYVVSIILKNTDEVIPVAQGKQSLVTNKPELKEKPVTAQEIRKSGNVKNIEFNLLSNKYLHIPSTQNSQPNIEVSSIDIDECLWFIVQKNLEAQKQARISAIDTQRKELKEEKTVLQKNDDLNLLMQ